MKGLFALILVMFIAENSPLETVTVLKREIRYMFIFVVIDTGSCDHGNGYSLVTMVTVL